MRITCMVISVVSRMVIRMVSRMVIRMVSRMVIRMVVEVQFGLLRHEISIDLPFLSATRLAWPGADLHKELQR